jgi:2-oxoisovalerate dehydrogenase E2 component (dihydrolipoyl transacylase)
MSEFKLPDVGEGLTEAEIVTWKVKVGDVIEINDIVVEIETAKSLVELPSPYAGTVTALLVPEGETVAVGTPIIRVGDEAEAPADAPAPKPMSSDDIDLSNPAASGSGEGESLVGRMKAERGSVRRARHGGSHVAVSASAAATQQQVQSSFQPGIPSPDVVEQADEPAVPATPAPVVAGGARALAKPPVRKLAKDLGVDISALTGTGPNGTVTREDVHGG